MQRVAEQRLADRAYSEIVALIEARQMNIGDRLPSESNLAAAFSMSRTVVREALVRLASDGITEPRRGAGSFVKGRPSQLLAAHMPFTELSATLGAYEVRFVLEAEAARLASRRRSEAQMAAIDAALSALRHALMSIAPAHEEDLALHREIIAATGNPAFAEAFDALKPSVERIMRAGVDISRHRPPEVIATMMREHETIVEAIRARDQDAAALAMRWHLSEGRKRLVP